MTDESVPLQLDSTKKRYDCKENDNHIIFEFADDRIDSLYIGDCLENSWTIIGMKDLKKALKKMGYDVKRRK